MSLFLTVGAMAQLENGKIYRFKDNASGKYLNAANHNTHETGPNGGVTVATLNESSKEMIFIAEQSGDGFKLKTKSGYYLNGHEWNVDANSTTDGMVLLFEQANGGYKIKWVSTASKYYGQTKYFKVENVSGTIYPFCDAAQNNAATWTIEKLNYVHNTGNINRDDRGFRSFTITDRKNSLEVTDIQTSRTAPVYVDKSSQKFTTTAGATLSFSAFNWIGQWMHAYAYVDYNKDCYFELVNNNEGTNEGEIVSYNYYNGKTITGTQSSNQFANGNTYDGSKGLPAFKLPENLTPGEYRMRIKIDWENLDADKGASDIAGNGGCQCDITLVVVPANTFAKQELYNAIQEAEASLATITIGERVGEYSCGGHTHAEIESYLGSARNFYESIGAETPVETIEAYIEFINGTMELCALNMPKNGEYFRVAYDYGGTVGKLYLQGLDSEQEKDNQLSFPAKFAADNGAESIWYYYDGALYSYTAGRCLNETGDNRGLYNIGEKVDATFSASTRAAGKYNIACSSYVHANVTGLNYHTDHCKENNCSQHDLILEPVTKLPVSISAAKYATFYAPVAVNVPEGVTAHTVTIDGEWAKLSEESLTVIPAYTGVVLYSENPATYTFAVSNQQVAPIENNALEGTVAATYIAKDAYVLANHSEAGIGFYKAKLNFDATGNKVAEDETGTHFLNNHHKAYLVLPTTVENPAAYYSFRFGEGTTGIGEVKGENGEVKAIYDLTGRRIEAITTPGIYIVGGKKVLVK